MCCILFWRALSAKANLALQFVYSWLCSFFQAMQRKKSHTSMLTKIASKFEWLGLQFWITKKHWLTDMQESLLFVSVVESFYWAINSSIASFHMIMLIRFILRSSSLQNFYLLSHTIDIHIKAYFIKFFVFVYLYQKVFYFIHPQRNSILK